MTTSTIIEKGTIGYFAEIEENDIIKRVFLPDTIPSSQLRLKQLLQSHAVNLQLIRVGKAVLQEEEPWDGFGALESFNAAGGRQFSADFCGSHPVAAVGKVRFIPNLCDMLEQMVDPILSQAETPAQPVPVQVLGQPQDVDLTEQLRQQLEKEKTPVQVEVVKKEETPLVVPDVAPAVTVQSLDSFIAQKKEEKKQEPATTHIPYSDLFKFAPKPTSKMDLILQKLEHIEQAIGLESDKTVSASELKDWFYQYKDEHGEEAVFEYLSTKILKG